MRPRGESSSSPSSTKVGQVALQKPQWTQARRILSASAVAGFLSCTGEKFVCISKFRPHAARLQNSIWIERRLQPSRQSGEPLRLRLEHRDHRASLLRGADQGRMPAAIFPNRLTNEACGRAGARIEREPDQAARPIEQGFGVMRAGNRLGDFRSGGWRNGNFPDDFFAWIGERRDIADGPPKLLRVRRVETGD